MNTIFDEQVDSYVEFENKTQNTIFELQAKIIRLNKVVQMKKDILMQHGSEKYGIKHFFFNQKFAMSKKNLETKLKLKKMHEIHFQYSSPKISTQLRAQTYAMNPDEEEEDAIIRQLDLSLFENIYSNKRSKFFASNYF